MRFRPDVAGFMQAQATASNRSVANFLGALPREKARFEESQRQFTVQTVADLLRHERHGLLRDVDEADAEYAARSDCLGCCSTTPGAGDGPGISAGKIRLVRLP